MSLWSTPPPGLDICNLRVADIWRPDARGWEGGCGPWQRRDAGTFPAEAAVIVPGSPRLRGPLAGTVLPLPSVPRAGPGSGGKERRIQSRCGESRVWRRLAAGVSGRALPEGRFPRSPLARVPAAGAPPRLILTRAPPAPRPLSFVLLSCPPAAIGGKQRDLSVVAARAASAATSTVGTWVLRGCAALGWEGRAALRGGTGVMPRMGHAAPVGRTAGTPFHKARAACFLTMT